MAAPAYIDPVADPLRPLTAADIETVWGQMAEVMHGAFSDQQYLLREFGTRIAWGNDGNGAPFDFHGVAYRVTDVCKGALK